MPLTWVEPPAYFRSKRSKRPPLKDQLLLAVGVFAFGAGVRYLSSLQPAQRNQPVHWPSFLGLCLIISLFIAFGWPWIAGALSASHIVVSDKGINNNLQVGTSVRVKHWPWSEIGSVGTELDQGRRIMVIKGTRGQILERLAIKDSISDIDLRKQIELHGGPWASGTSVV